MPKSCHFPPSWSFLGQSVRLRGFLTEPDVIDKQIQGSDLICQARTYYLPLSPGAVQVMLIVPVPATAGAGSRETCMADAQLPSPIELVE